MLLPSFLVERDLSQCEVFQSLRSYLQLRKELQQAFDIVPLDRRMDRKGGKKTRVIIFDWHSNRGHAFHEFLIIRRVTI